METREILAWTIAALAVASVAFSFATREAASPIGASPKIDERAALENRRLRSALIGLRGEQRALRGELDRLLARVRAGQPMASESSAASTPGGEARGEARARARVGEIAADISRLSAEIAAGEGEGTSVLFARVAELQAMGPEALPALKDAFRSSDDPALKRILTTIFAVRGGEEEQSFLLEAAERETDPEVKQALLSNVSLMGERGRAAAQAKTKDLIGAPESATRAGAIRGIINFDDPEVASAVERALSEDPSESVRLAALDALLRDSARREDALRIAANDGSGRIREIAECRARVADLEASLAE